MVFDMTILDIVATLLSSPFVWSVVALCVCQINMLRLKRIQLVSAQRRWAMLSRMLACCILGIIIAQHRVYLYSGPVSGRVTSAEGAPVVNARVVISCERITSPIMLPWYAAVFNRGQREQSSISFSDKEGNYRLPWIGFSVWKSGCSVFSLSVTQEAFEPDSLSSYSDGVFQGHPTRLFGRHDFQLRSKRKSP
jgi:hypothetical protein